LRQAFSLPKLPFMHQKRHEIEEQELQGFKYFKVISGLLEKLHEVGCARDRAGNRLLHMDQYVALLLLYMFNRNNGDAPYRNNGDAPYYRPLLSHLSPAAQACAAIPFSSTSSSPSGVPEPPTISSQLHPGCFSAENCPKSVQGTQVKSDK
jgi:hypothetical protein